MFQLGHYPPPRHAIAHISDTHLLAGGRPLYGVVDTDAQVARTFAQLERSGMQPEAVVITGDLADLGEPEAYHRLKELVEPAVERLGSQLIWVMGNHDEREPYSSILFGQDPSTAVQDRVHEVNGLRIISLDSTVPGYHHGDLETSQLEWLRDVLATPAPDGTVIALHHPPLPTPVDLMAVIELDHQDEFADVVRGTDVRVILGGHLHYSTTGMFAGIPVSVAAATCYTIDTSFEPGALAGVDAGQTFNLVHFYEDQVVHSVVPINDAPRIAGFSGAVLSALAAMSPQERREAFSRKQPSFDLAAFARQIGVTSYQ